MTPPTDRSAAALRAVVTALGITIGAVPATLHAQAAKPAADSTSRAGTAPTAAAATQIKAPTAAQIKAPTAPTAAQMKGPAAVQIKLAPAAPRAGEAVQQKGAASPGTARAEDEEPPVQARPAGSSAPPPAL